jgi:Zn-dependent protease with chaperone function
VSAPAPDLSGDRGEAQQDRSSYRPVPGPADRESFDAAQRRYRRQTWRLIAFCGLAAIVTGVPLSLVLTPIIFAVILVLTRILDIVLPVPHAVWDAYGHAGLVLVRVFDAVGGTNSSGVQQSQLSKLPVQDVLSLAALWLLPGVIFMLLLWPVISLLFRRAGTPGTLLSLGAREPKPTDLEERQLVNVVEELAIAAGLPPPKVMLIDAPVANAAVVGTSPEDAVILVTRPLLDDLNRDETQGVLAHLVASIGNGDLRGALAILAVFQTFGFVSAVIRFPIDGEARRTVWRMVRLVFERPGTAQGAADARKVSSLLTKGLDDLGEKDDFQFLMSHEEREPKQRPGPRLGLLLYFPGLALVLFIASFFLGFSSSERKLLLTTVVVLALLLIWYQRVYAVWAVGEGVRLGRAMFMLPYYIGAMMPLMMLMILKGFLLEPLIALLWRARRYLADATAVQLTRNPDGLAEGLSELIRRGGAIPGGAWAAPFFVVGAETSSVRIANAMRAQALKARQATSQGSASASGSDAELGPASLHDLVRVMRQMGSPEQIEKLKSMERDGKVDPAAFVESLRQAGLTQQAALIENLARERQIMEPPENDPPASEEEASFSESISGGMARLHPSLPQRLQRLQRMGATDVDPRLATRRHWFFPRGRSLLITAIFVPLLALIPILLLVALALMALLALFFTSIMMMLVYGLFLLIVPT